MDPGYDASFDELQAFNLDFIVLLREQYINGGFSFNGWRFDSDERARSNIAGVATLALSLSQQGGMPNDFAWRDSLNVDRPMPGLAILQLGAALFTQVSDNYYTYRTHKANIVAITDYDQLLLYDCTVNWQG